MRRLSTCIVLTLALVAPWSVVAAQENDDSTAEQQDSDTEQTVQDESGTQRRVFKDRIVVTASRQEEESANTPAPITVMNRQYIEQAQPEKMADLFKQIPGVEVEGEGPFRGLPVIRGFSSNRVLILVDGQRLNNARESTTFAGIQPGLVNLAEVEKIEVLRGPASVQYGSDAIGGVINIITRSPDLGAEDFTISGDVSYEYGTSSDSQNARAFISGSGSGWGFTLGGVFQEANNYTAASGASEDDRFSSKVNENDEVYNSGMEQTAIDGSLRFATGQNGVFRVNAEVVRTKDIGFPGFDPASGIDFSFPHFDRDKIGLAWNSGPMWGLDDLGFNTYYQTVDKRSIRNIDALPFFGSFSDTTSKIDSIGFNAQGIANVGINHLTFGLDFYQDKLDDTAVSQSCTIPFAPCNEPSNEVAVPDSKQTGLGIYLQDQISLSDSFTLHAGLRGDTFDFESEDDPDYIGDPFDVTDDAVSGNLGLTYAVTDNVNLNAVVGRGFRSPNLQERSFIGLASTGDTFIIQNANLSSERSLNYELGFKARYDRYFGGLTMFYNDVKDFITFNFLDPDFPDCPDDPRLDCGQFENIAEATIWGIELELETIFATWWTLFTNASYTEGDNDITNEPLSLIPPLKAVVGLRFQQPRWWVEGSVRAVDRQDRVPAEVDESPGYAVYDLRAGYDFDFGLGLIASVENISDKLYAETFNQDPEPGRNLRISARYRF
jgi:hemoglobin/transferrin/lactoferrin receptor protein